MRGVCSWNSDSQALSTRCSPFLKRAALERSPDYNSVLGRCFRACCWCRRGCTGMCKPQTGTIKGSMQNGTFQTYPPLPAFTLHTLLSLRTSHISIYHYSCHSVTYKVFCQYMVLCDTGYYSKRNTKSTLPSGSSAQESSFHFSLWLVPTITLDVAYLRSSVSDLSLVKPPPWPLVSSGTPHRMLPRLMPQRLQLHSRSVS